MEVVVHAQVLPLNEVLFFGELIDLLTNVGELLGGFQKAKVLISVHDECVLVALCQLRA